MIVVDKIRDLTACGSGVFFAARTDDVGWEPWTSSGTLAGTRLVKDVAAGTADSQPGDFTAVGATAFFVASASDGVADRHLWRTDGTAAGTVRVTNAPPGTAANLTAVGSRLSFTAFDEAAGRELWVVPGGSSVAQRVADIMPGAASSVPGWLTARGTTLFFTATGAGGDIWRSDGTSAGTKRVADVPATPVVQLGAGVAGGATRAEAMQASGVVTVAGTAGHRISVAFVGTTSGAVDPSKIFFKEVTGAGPGTPVPAVLTDADVTRLGDGLVYVNALQVDPAGNASAHASRSFTIDTRAPAATAVTPPPARPVVPGVLLRVTVTFAEAVIVRGGPFIVLTFDGNVTRRDRARGRWSSSTAPCPATGRRGGRRWPARSRSAEA